MRGDIGLHTTADEGVKYAVVLRSAVVPREKIVFASQSNRANEIFNTLLSIW